MVRRRSTKRIHNPRINAQKNPTTKPNHIHARLQLPTNNDPTTRTNMQNLKNYLKLSDATQGHDIDIPIPTSTLSRLLDPGQLTQEQKDNLTDFYVNYIKENKLTPISNKENPMPSTQPQGSQEPDSIKEHQDKYKPDAWKDYTIDELGHWVHLLTKRSEHRQDQTKKQKDLEDAQNYLNMIQSHLNAAKQQ